ncbi:hypothetical protein Mboo_1730 [Methanoregula boonei 6A8]|uniref:Uncharacterized protein n=2 Tax=Methanoregula TaxID=395331 RepID=A7I936_METB6|nr:hypothetical protein Mboo_1730 [Methanoregula boonei 6A8]
MLKFLKSLLLPSTGNTITLAEHDVPAWLDEREKAAREVLRAEVAEPVQAIQTAKAQLQLTVNNLQGADQDPEAHPRIKSIAKNSLPLFLKAMNTSLARELPEDPEEFYAAAVECVKGALNAARGQGRYLNVAFPDEMKDIRAGIDAIGREINTMTKAIGRFKEESARIAAARAAAGSLSAARNDRVHSLAKEKRLKERLCEITERLSSIETETARLNNDPAYLALENDRARCAELAAERDNLLRHYAALTMTASHVFRKAEKIAAKKKLSKEVHILKSAMEILSHHDVATAREVTGALEAACPVVQKMVDDGEIILKNRDERTVFSDTAAFSREVGDLCTRHCAVTGQFKEEEDLLASHPIPSRLRSLVREKEQLDHMQAREEQEHHDLLSAQKEREETIPHLYEELAKKLGEMKGETVQLVEDEPV